MFVTSHGPEVIQPTPHMYQASRKALTDLTEVPLHRVSSYLDLGRAVGHAGDHLLNVALWKPEGIELTDPETHDLDSTMLPQQMPLWSVSKVIENQRVAVGADIPSLAFSASVETFASSDQDRSEVWQIQSVLGQIMAKDVMDVGTFARHTTESGDQMYYPFSMFSKEMAEDPQKVTRGFLFGLQEIASAVLRATDRPTLEK